MVERRQLVLRRLMDAILFQVLYPDHRATRYFATQTRTQPIDPDVLRRTAETAHRRNREDRLKCHAICDLTSIAQIGDLIRVDRSIPTGGWTIIELKEDVRELRGGASLG